MVTLSNRQYPMIRAFIDGGERYYMTFEEAQKYDQRPFRSMLIRKWIAYTPRRGFHLTRAGKEAWSAFLSTNIWRLDSTRPLTAYFDAVAYGLPAPHKPEPKKAVA